MTTFPSCHLLSILTRILILAGEGQPASLFTLKNVFMNCSLLMQDLISQDLGEFLVGDSSQVVMFT